MAKSKKIDISDKNSDWLEAHGGEDVSPEPQEDEELGEE